MRPRGNTFIQAIQLYDKYARWRPEDQRRETWAEAVDRVMAFLQQQPRANVLTPEVWAQLHTALLSQDVLPSMRVVQMAGAPLDRCHVGAYNCAYTTLCGPQDVAEVLYILMQGTGVGYSVERRYVDQWPAVSEGGPDAPVGTYVVPDTTEGWCEAFRHAVEGALIGQRWTFDLSQLRPEGTWLHTKGGRASGPAPLHDLLSKTWEIVRARAGARLRPLDVHRLATLCGSIVQVGGVRRAAEIALFDADDSEMRTCKTGDFWRTMPELAMANNSMVIPSGQPPDLHLLSAMAEAANAGTGEPGLFRRDGRIPERRQAADFGTNPCGEIILRPHQFCNLSVAVARPTDTAATLAEKVQLATIVGTLQADLTQFQYLRPTWAQNCEEERLLGVDITGACDCPLLTDPDTSPALLQQLQQVARQTNVVLAAQMGIAASTAVTCNKPSGNSSQLLDASSGIHPRYAPYYLRRLRVAARSPLALHLQQQGLPMYPEVGQGTLAEARVWVTELPVQSPEGSLTRHDLSGLDQLAYWLMWKTCWTEHNPSCTIYLKPHEWVAATAFVSTVWEAVGGLAFLPHSDHVYTLAPYEEIDAVTYEARLALLPEELGLADIREQVDTTTVAQDYACVGGVCEI